MIIKKEIEINISIDEIISYLYTYLDCSKNWYIKDSKVYEDIEEWHGLGINHKTILRSEDSKVVEIVNAMKTLKKYIE